MEVHKSYMRLISLSTFKRKRQLVNIDSLLLLLVATLWKNMEAYIDGLRLIFYDVTNPPSSKLVSRGTHILSTKILEHLLRQSFNRNNSLFLFLSPCCRIDSKLKSPTTEKSSKLLSATLSFPNRNARSWKPSNAS